MPHLTVPFNPAWIGSDKLDVKAIYRRPRKDALGNRVIVAGLPQWDLTAGLPVRRHNDWAAKGFEYVSLATWADVVAAGNTLLASGYTANDFVELYAAQGEADRRGFRVDRYQQATAADATAAYGKLAELVKLHGSAHVQDMMTSLGQGTLPAELQGLEPEPVAVRRGPGRPRKVAEAVTEEQPA